MSNAVLEKYGVEKYKLVINPDFVKLQQPVFVDCETDEKDNLVGIGVCSTPDEIYYFTELKSDLKEILSKAKLVGHNIKADAKWLNMWGVQIDPCNLINDTALMSYVQNSTRESHSLKSLGKEVFNIERPNYKDIVGKGHKKKTLDKQPVELVADYCTMDVYTTVLLYNHFIRVLNPVQKRILNMIELPCMRILYQMEINGVLIDTDKLLELDKLFSDKLDALKKDMYSISLREFNPNSTQQTADVLTSLGISLPYTDKGNKKVDKETLSEYKHIPLVNLLLDYSKYEKLKSTYTQGLLELKTLPKVHTNYNQITNTDKGISTSRLSCVASWTPIVTDKGIKKICEISVGDKVFTHKGRWKKVLRTIIKGKERMIEVTFCNGYTMTCTESHRLLINRKWVSVKEIIDVIFKVMGTEQLGKGCKEIQRAGFSFNNDDCKRDGYALSQCSCVCETEYPTCRISGVKSNKVLQVKNRGQKPNERKNRKEASQLERLMRGRLWISDNNKQRKKTICSPCCHVRSSWNKGTTKKSSRPSHRRKWTEQLFGQPCLSNKSRAQEHTLSSVKGLPCTSIKKAHYVGSHTVYDIEVESDHSYLSCGVFSHNSNQPNLQQIPARTEEGAMIREAFVPSKGKVFIDADFSQIELRLLAHFSKDRLLLDSFRNNKDLHTETAKAIFRKEEVTDNERQTAKTFSFAILYGAQKDKIAKTLKISVEEAERLLQNYWKALPSVVSWTNRVKYEARIKGGIFTLHKRWIPLPDIRSHNRYEVMANERRAVNYTIQGSAAEIMKLSLIKCWEAGYKSLLTVHDELVFEAYEPTVEKDVLAIKRIMETCVTLDVPLISDIGVGKNWKEAKL